MIPKLTQEQMAEVFELRDKGVSWDNLTYIFSISASTLQKYYRLAEEYGFGFWYGEQYRVQENTRSKLELENAVLRRSLELQTDTFRELFDELLARIISVEQSLDDLRTIYHENNYSRKPTRN